MSPSPRHARARYPSEERGPRRGRCCGPGDYDSDAQSVALEVSVVHAGQLTSADLVLAIGATRDEVAIVVDLATQDQEVLLQLGDPALHRLSATTTHDSAGSPEST